MSILHFCQWLENTPVGVAVRQSVWLFPIVETTHTVGIALMAGTIAVVDLRLLGFGLRREPVTAVLQQVLPWTHARGAGEIGEQAPTDQRDAACRRPQDQDFC